MRETDEQIVTEQKPAWLELPDKREYWTCEGIVLKRPIWKRFMPTYLKQLKDMYVTMFYSKEDAECSASEQRDYWKWDGQSAQKYKLSASMREARQHGRKGVQVQSFQNGQWVTVKEYPANEPLPLELRD